MSEKDREELTDQECYDAALAWVNDTRAEYGGEALDELPSGARYDVSACVLAQALGPVIADESSCDLPGNRRYTQGDGDAPPGMLHFGRGGHVYHRTLPVAVAEFALRFDRGRYPQLLLGTRVVLGTA